MDQLLLPYLQATDESERQQLLDELLLVHAAPVVRQALRRRPGFYVDERGTNPHNQDAEDLFQEIMAKIVQALHDLRNSVALISTAFNSSAKCSPGCTAGGRLIPRKINVGLPHLLDFTPLRFRRSVLRQEYLTLREDDESSAT